MAHILDFDFILMAAVVPPGVMVVEDATIHALDGFLVEDPRVGRVPERGQIGVEGAEGYTVCLYDVVGRLLATKRETAQEVLLDVPASGAYLVKIGDAPARRIVVRR